MAVKSVIRQKKGREDYKVTLKKARNCVIAGIVMFGVGMATSDDSAEKPKQDTVAQEQAQPAAQQEAQAAAEKQETSAVNIDVTEQNKQDKAALEEYVTSTLAGKYKLKNLSTTTFPAEGHDVYAVDFEISKKCTADEAQAEARKIRGLLDAFPAPVDSVRIVFSSGLIAYSPDKPEFVQIAGGQRTTFK